MERNAPSKWSWIICNLPLKQFVNGENITWSLQPSITLSHPSGEGPDPNIKIVLDQEKSFQYTEELGWNWHKSWKLPTISLQLEITDSEKGDTLLCPKDIYVHIFAVKALVDSNNKLCLVDVGLRGTNKMELVDGKAVFQTLKFASTSYNNEGVKFHLLMCVYLQISEDTKPKILKAIISPPIFVDSRKSVRENDKLSENKLFLYIEPFYPDNFTRKFVKKETKKKESIEEEIQNGVDGLYSYLTAPNIRNKVKHPIFLCVRFSNCVSFYYNPELTTEEDKDNLVEFFQNLLFEDIEKGQEAEIKLQDSFFLLYINKNELEDKLKKKKILELLCPIKCKSLSVVFNKAEIPPSFIQIQDLRWLMELYSKSYSKLLMKSKYCLRGDDENDDEDGPTDRIPPPERQLINFAHESAPRTQNDWNKYFDTSSLEHQDPNKRLKSEDPNASPLNMVEARTNSFRESIGKLFPNGQEPVNPALPGAGGNPMATFPGLKPNNPLLMNIFQNKGAPETPVGPVSGIPQMNRGMMGANPMHGMNSGAANPAAGRFPPNVSAGRGQNYGMDPAMMMMMMQGNKFNPINPLNMMNQMGQMGQRGQFGGMANFQQMMRAAKDGDGANPGSGMTAERMQAMMQNFQQYQQMYQRDGDGAVKAENTGDNWNASDINVKVPDNEDGDYSEDNRSALRRNNRRGNDINVKDEESIN